MIKAVLFDQDGVIIDTERDGHRVAFEKVFEKYGFNIKWDVEFYHKLLQVGGGKERLKYYFENYYNEKVENLDALIKQMHKDKTEILIEMLESLPLRPGIHRLMGEIIDAGIPIGICTTSNEKVAETIAKNILGDIPFDIIIAGDMVKKKKPDPEIYLMALKKLQVKPSECLVIEDSNIGIRAAKAAGCKVIATYNGYTKDEDLSMADMIASSLGEENGEKAEIEKNAIPLINDGVISLSDIIASL